MALTLPVNFEQDVQSRDTALFPVVQFSKNYVHKTISTNSFTESGGEHWLPLLLSIPGLKESIDIEKRNYKISNVVLNISNLPYDGKRFSDLLSETYGSAINVECNIYWASPSTTGVFHENTGAFQIYSGAIRRFDHSDEKVRITLEDRSQANLHKDLPLKSIGAGNEIPDRFKNKPYPMVYGTVDKSPCIGSQTDTGEVQIHADTPESATYVHRAEDESGTLTNHPLLIFKDDVYFEVLNQDFYFWKNQFDFPDSTQYIVDHNIISINTPLDDIDTGDHRSPLSQNRFAALVNDSPISSHFWTDADEYISQDVGGYTTDMDHHYFFPNWTTPDIGTQYHVDRINHEEFGYNFFKEYRIGFNFISVNSVPAFDVKVWYYINYNVNITGMNTQAVHDADENIEGRAEPYREGFSSIFKVYDPDNTNTASYVANNVPFTNEYGWEEETSQQITSQTIRIFPHNYARADCSLTVNSIKRRVLCLMDGFRESDFYAVVTGRIHQTPQADEVIKNIITEINPSIGNAINTITGTYADSFKYQFTINEKANSKEIIENISSASPFIARFDYLGNFKFNVIPEDGGTLSGLNGNEIIKEADVIDFSFNRTKIEDVYTKVEFHYNWDYAREKFNDKEVYGVDDAIADEEMVSYDRTYYGFPSTGDDESTLIIDDDRGKYIRKSHQHNTAQAFAKWMLYWHCNQHLKIKVKLPLKYMNLEIADIIKFDKLIGGIKTYGLDYSATHNGLPGEKPVYSNFMITSTNKTLEYVQIECIQLHNLSYSIEIHDCADSAACNHNSSADVDNGTCTYENECFDCDGNLKPEADLDGDGICDILEACLGEYDTCGVCTPPGEEPIGALFDDCHGVPHCTQEQADAVECECSNWRSMQYTPYPDFHDPFACVYPVYDGVFSGWDNGGEWDIGILGDSAGTNYCPHSDSNNWICESNLADVYCDENGLKLPGFDRTGYSNTELKELMDTLRAEYPDYPENTPADWQGQPLFFLHNYNCIPKDDILWVINSLTISFHEFGLVAEPEWWEGEDWSPQPDWHQIGEEIVLQDSVPVDVCLSPDQLRVTHNKLSFDINNFINAEYSTTETLQPTLFSTTIFGKNATNEDWKRLHSIDMSEETIPSDNSFDTGIYELYFEFPVYGDLTPDPEHLTVVRPPEGGVYLEDEIGEHPTGEPDIDIDLEPWNPQHTDYPPMPYPESSPILSGYINYKIEITLSWDNGDFGNSQVYYLNLDHGHNNSSGCWILDEAGNQEGGDYCPSEAGSGDVNGDGESNVLDIVQITNVILGGEFADECAAAAADMNGDGSGDVLDIVQIVNIILGE